RGNVHVRIARAGTGKPTTPRPQGVPSPTQHIPFDPEAASLFFSLISSRYERRSLIVTSNKNFSAWAEIFGDAVAVAAMVDRLVHHANVIVLKGKSYRLRGKRKEITHQPTH
ncbi:MAG: ATP-binding protein, partial [bacterium]|nr:ATP-binding protein [bacterium]